MKAPDYLEPFIGWKGLDADEHGQLFSPSVRTAWPAGEALVAHCDRKHAVPGKSCSCGIYAVTSFEALRERGYNWRLENEEKGIVAVIAEIALYGHVVVAADGYRAEKAYPRKVYISPAHLRLGGVIRRRYGCDVGLIDRFTGRRM